jgi:diguanylate cyclase
MSKPKQDLGDIVIAHLKKLGVGTMPSNYEVFYHAMSGSYPALREALVELGERPTQGEIDAVAEQHFPQRSEARVIHNAQRQLTRQIGDLQSKATAEAAELREFTHSMDNVSAALGDEDVTREKAFEALAILIGAAKLKKESADELSRELVEQGVVLEQVKKELKDAQRLASEDQLTGALNRRAFDDKMNEIYEQKDYFQYSLLMLDIDHFKRVNDKYGHPGGDHVLRVVAQIIKQNLRGSVQLYRYGGEEFGIFLKNIDSEIVGKIAERIRRAVEGFEMTSRRDGEKLSVTVSLGFCMADQAESGVELLDKADKALYASKQRGRNQITDWSKLDMRRDKTTGRYEMYRPGLGL